MTTSSTVDEKKEPPASETEFDVGETKQEPDPIPPAEEGEVASRTINMRRLKVLIFGHSDEDEKMK